VKLTWLTVAGYRGYRAKTVLKIPAGLTLITGINEDDHESNGAGKSTIFYGVCVGLYGVEPKGGKKDDLISYDADGYSIELQFENPHLVVRRSKKRGYSEKLAYNWEGKWSDQEGDDWTEGRLTATQAELDKVLGVSYDLFCNAHYISRHSKASQMLAAKPAERARLLEEMVTDEHLKKAEELVKAASARLEEELSQKKSAKSVHESSELRQKSQLDQIQNQLNSSAERQRRWQERHDESVRTTSQSLAEQEALRRPVDALDVITAEVQSLGRSVDTLYSDIRIAESNQKRLEKAHGTKECSQCLQTMTIEGRELLQIEINALGRQLPRLRAEHKAAQKSWIEKSEWLNQQQRLAGHNNEVERQIGLLTQQLKNYEREVSPENPEALKALRKDCMAGLRETEATLIKLSQEILGLEGRREDYKFWRDGFGPNGIRNMMLDDLRTAMAFATQKYIRQLAGDSIKIDFPQAGKRASSKDKFEILVTMHGRTVPLHMLSDGEDWRASFACLLGLGDVLQGFSRQRLDLRLIDDPLGDLDDAGIRNFMTAAYDMFAESGSVLVAVPRAVDIDFRATIWTVRKTNGESAVTQ
jgi:DNA repair exonuclease SbcCD ATPase subunit